MVAKSWFLATEARLQKAIAEDMAAAAERQLGFAQDRLRVGLGNEYDVTLARANLATYRDSVRSLDLAYQQALRALETLAGRYPGAGVKVLVMYALYDHGGIYGGNVLTYDWAAMGVKVDDCDATWVNGPWHGEWLPLEQTVKAGKDGRIMIFLQVISPLAENVSAYFDNVQVWVDGKPFSG